VTTKFYTMKIITFESFGEKVQIEKKSKNHTEIKSRITKCVLL